MKMLLISTMTSRLLLPTELDRSADDAMRLNSCNVAGIETHRV
jgi:hypothetical protein